MSALHGIGRARWLPGAVAALVLIGVTTTSRAAPAAEPPELQQKRAWVAEVERGDYFFWQRFFLRRDNPREFPLPPEWYRPSEIVEGEPSAPLTVRAASKRRLSAGAIAELESYLRPRETGAFYVLHAGEIDYQSFGPGVHPGSLLAVRSLAKILPALLMGIAIDEGHVHGIDDRVDRYLQEWRGDPRGAITVRQLLSMSSGLEQVPIRFEPDNKGLRLAEGSDVNGVALDYRLVRDPDTGWALNNADTQLLALILERVTGRRYADYLSEKLWRPMGLDAATLNLDGPRGTARAFCCMRARGPDWLKLGAMLLHDGVWRGRRVLPSGWLSTMRAPTRANAYSGMHLFLGWGPGDPPPTFPLPKYTQPFASRGVFFMTGGISTGLWMVPEFDLVILRWGNDPPDWDTTYVPNLVIEDFRHSSGRRSACAARTAGCRATSTRP